MRNYIFSLLCLYLVFIPSFSQAISLNYEKNRVVVVQGEDFRQQVLRQNTIYEIRNAFDLDGREVVIPAGCELLFTGGYLCNGTLIGNNTVIDSPPFLCVDKSITFKGTWNSPFNILWMCRQDIEDDIAVALNNVQKVFKHIIIPRGEYYIKTAAILNDVQLDWYGDIIYRGSSKQINLITLSSVCNLNMAGSLTGFGSVVNGASRKQTDIHGLVIKNCSNSRFTLGNISWFNVGLEIVGDDAGCAYNTFNLASIRDCNINLLITQRNKKKSIGYCNENLFIGGRFGRTTSWRNRYGTEGNISIACLADYYSDDVYKSVNSLTFIKPCIEDESNTYAIVLDNASRCSFSDIRLEGNDKHNIQLKGACGDLYFSPSFGSLSFDLSKLTVRDNTPLFSNKFMSEYCFGALTYQLCAEDINESLITNDYLELKHKYINYISPQMVIIPSFNLKKNTDGNVDNLGFRISFDEGTVQQKYIRVIVHKKGNSRTNVHCKATATTEGMPVKNQENDSFYRIVSLSYNSKYNRWSSGTNVQEVSMWPKEDVKEVTFMLDNAYGATIITTGHIVPAL